MKEFEVGSLVHIASRETSAAGPLFYPDTRRLATRAPAYAPTAVFVVLEQRVQPRTTSLRDETLRLLSPDGTPGSVYVYYYNITVAS